MSGEHFRTLGLDITKYWYECPACIPPADTFATLSRYHEIQTTDEYPACIPTCPADIFAILSSDKKVRHVLPNVRRAYWYWDIIWSQWTYQAWMGIHMFTSVCVGTVAHTQTNACPQPWVFMNEHPLCGRHCGAYRYHCILCSKAMRSFVFARKHWDLKRYVFSSWVVDNTCSEGYHADISLKDDGLSMWHTVCAPA